MGIELAESVKDEITGDMLLAIHSSLEKHGCRQIPKKRTADSLLCYCEL